MSIIATTDAAIKQGMPVMIHSGVPVATSEQLSRFYDTDVNNIKKNYSRNASRFLDGKHYFLITGSKLKELKNSVTFGHLVDKRAPKLTLWTERGAARHAKMLETDRAWDVFEKLEDFYFSQRGEVDQVRKVRQSTATQLIPLRQTAERLITTGIGKIYPDIWKLVHERFDVEHIHQLQPAQIKEAVAYLDGLEGEFIGKQAMPARSGFTDEEIQVLCWLWSYADYMRDYMQQIYPMLRAGEHRLAGAYCSMPQESPRTINAARRILLGATEHIDSGPTRQDNWRVLYRMRHEHDIHPQIGE
ncbi:ORF6N domain-containing protein [Pectobacterium carotovorum]|uniref:ORF6N domain-containing protein n=1 Tax=Pectobacterium carotovorum TaxID=554 RepID=UPI0021F37664|nr:ORF6N domain-containing protein [Pectobacterium carotovorum]